MFDCVAIVKKIQNNEQYGSIVGLVAINIEGQGEPSLSPSWLASMLYESANTMVKNGAKHEI